MIYFAGIGEREIKVDSSVDMDICPKGENIHHILNEGKSFIGELEEIDSHAKVVRVKINGNSYTVKLKDPLDKAIEAMGFKDSSDVADDKLFAPMPGLIVDVLVKEGEGVTKGQPILILEAMKMENVLKSERDGIISHIAVKKGDAVDKKALLVEL